MKNRIIAITVLAGSLMLGQGLAAQDTMPPERDRPPLPDDLKGLIQDFREQRREILDARRALVEALKNATEEERAEIIAAFRAEQRDRIREERELRKEIHRELRELRRARRQVGTDASSG